MTNIRGLLTALLFCVAVATAQKAPDHQSHTYAQVGGKPLKLDFYNADSEIDAPLIIWIHGGAWQSGSRRHVPAEVLKLCSEGIAVASIDYRLTSQFGQWGKEPVHWPAQRDDAKAAVRWLRANKETLRLDDSKFVVWGASAGGHLAAILGLTNNAPGTCGKVGKHLSVSSAVRLAIDFFGPTDLFTMNEDVTTPPGSVLDHDAANSPESLVAGVRQHGHTLKDIRDHIDDKNAPWPELVARVRSASPVHAVVRDHCAPCFIAHGTLDRVIAFEQGKRLQRRLRQLKISHQWHPVAGAGHGFSSTVDREAIKWMRAQLVKPLPDQKK
jgi:acetyl esterase/lipase